MSDIELVIKIPEEKYNQIINFYQEFNIRPKDYEIAIINGTILPKGHGRLIDANETLKAMDSCDKFAYSRHDMFKLTKESEKDYISHVYYSDMVRVVNNAPTIIEAD